MEQQLCASDMVYCTAALIENPVSVCPCTLIVLLLFCHGIFPFAKLRTNRFQRLFLVPWMHYPGLFKMHGNWQIIDSVCQLL